MIQGELFDGRYMPHHASRIRTKLGKYESMYRKSQSLPKKAELAEDAAVK